jgi:hypothetical protein
VKKTGDRKKKRRKTWITKEILKTGQIFKRKNKKRANARYKFGFQKKKKKKGRKSKLGLIKSIKGKWKWCPYGP